MLTFAKLLFATDAMKVPKEKTNIDFKDNKRNLNFVILGENIFLKLLTEIRRRITDM